MVIVIIYYYFFLLGTCFLDAQERFATLIASQAGEAPFARSDHEVSDDRMRRALTLLLLELLPLVWSDPLNAVGRNRTQDLRDPKPES